MNHIERWRTVASEQDPVVLLNYVPDLTRTPENLHRLCDLAEAMTAPEVPGLLPTRMSAQLCRWIESDMTLGLALALAVTAVHAEIIRPEDGEDVEVMREQLFARLTAVCPTEQVAAYVAVHQLGGAAAVSIAGWTEAALRDDSWTACRHILDRVALAVRNTAPGRRWFESITDLGFVLFQHT